MSSTPDNLPRTMRHPARSRFVVAGGLAVLLQVPLFWAFAAATTGGGGDYTCVDLTGPRRGELSERRVEVLEARCAPAEKRIKAFLARERPPEPAPAIPEDAQVVEVPDQPDLKEPPPVETKFLSNKTTRTEKETRSEVVKRSEVKGVGKAQIEEKSEVQAEKATSEKPTVTTNAQDKEVEVADARERFPQRDKGQQKAAADVDKGADSRILMPSTSSKNTLANLQALAADFTTNDHLPEVDRGKSTVLNANAYKFADFFFGVKRAVERYWKPGEVYLRRDPTGQVYGVKDRYTVLRVELDKSGQVKQLTTVRQSGLDFMDDEAKRAFRDAGPFPNPPVGLADADGFIRFEFGFFFEITGGKYRFNWRRL